MELFAKTVGGGANYGLEAAVIAVVAEGSVVFAAMPVSVEQWP